MAHSQASANSSHYYDSINTCVGIIMILITHQCLLRAGQAEVLWAWVGACRELAPGTQTAGKALFPRHAQ